MHVQCVLIHQAIVFYIYNNKMNSFVVNIFFVLLHISTLVNLTTADELGISACRYSGGFDYNNDACHDDPVKVKKLPDECTAFIYDGITCKDKNRRVYPTYINDDTYTIGLILEVSKNLHLLYGYEDIQQWSNAVQPDKAVIEAERAKKFFDYYQVAGLILKGINYDYGFPQDFSVPGDFNEKLKGYIQAMKSQMSNMKIGLYINATSVICYSSNSANPWYDIVMLNDVVDYYVIGFEEFNECTDDLLNGGVTPMDSVDPNINTLNKLKDALQMTNITKEKLYLEYLINPTVKKKDENTFMECERSYNEYCENAGYKYRWCADNQQTFFDKGVFAKQYANGFIAREIDLVDRDLKCKCDEDKYVTFHMVLNGFKGLKMLTCNKIDGS